MALWTQEETRTLGGLFRLVVTKRTRGGRQVDVTTFREARTLVSSFGAADPFGDAVASFTFPAITPLDDLQGVDLNPWLGKYSDVDLYWVPAVPLDSGDLQSPRGISPLTSAVDVMNPDLLSSGAWNKLKVWEGFLASIEFDDNDRLQIQCQGALFQVDRYLQKPFYPAQPWPLEALIADAFSRTERPELRTQPLKTVFPTGWTKKVPKYSGQSANVYSPVAKPGTNWTGYTSRNTGAWDHALTGFVQNELLTMIVDGASGVTPGNQWTITHQRASKTSPGRQPILQVRDRFRPVDFEITYGVRGVKLSGMSSDSTQSENVIYGDGTDINGQTWRNAIISNDGSRTDYVPLAASRDIYPPNSKGQPATPGAFRSEAYTKFGTGFSHDQAVTVAEQQLARDQDPGWTGSVALSIDPSPTLSRWLIQPGMTLRLKNFLGTGDDGMQFHVASTSANPEQGVMTLTIDTRYRDLLTVAEAQARTRDPLTPTRMLQVNKTSVMVEDIQAPWDYAAGSGFIPKASTEFYKNKPQAQPFPQVDWVRLHPPLHFPQYYIKVAAHASTPNGRWTQQAVPILTSEKGTIQRVEIFCVDAYGRPAKIPFHFSIYHTPVTVSDMPRRGGQSSPYYDGAFESTNPSTGQVWDAGNFLAPNDQFIIGWGNRAAGIYNRAGFSPGSEAEGGSPTGLLTDDSTWAFDNTSNPDYSKYAKPGVRQKASAITLYAMFYAEALTNVYFGGRLYRQNPGA